MTKGVSRAVAVGLALLLASCGGKKNDSGNTPSAGAGGGVTAGMSAGVGGSAGTGGGDFNPDCPTWVGPESGPYALKGECCYRTSNKERNDALPAGTKTGSREFRLVYAVTTNHPKTLTPDTIMSATINRIETEGQSLLFRFEGPRDPDTGKLASGPGTVTIGQGAYNCDGTYSFYGDKAAPDSTIWTEGPARWMPKPTPSTVDASKEFPDKQKAIWSMVDRSPKFTPFVDASFNLDFELETQGFNMLEFQDDEDMPDCVGKRDGMMWTKGGRYETWFRLDRNDTDIIDGLMQTFCQLVAFGGLMPNDADHSCKDTPRCVPGSNGCNWQKLPDSLCPTSEAEWKNWDCHVGDPMNEDKVETHCTMDPPTGALDPDKGEKNQGQCCDPLGKNTNGLPACNAYRLESEFVAAAVDITDAPAQALQKNCTTMK
jgi:hypothetical protein